MKSVTKNYRITRSVSIRPDQDAWFQALGGSGGNFSRLMQTLMDKAAAGEVDITDARAPGSQRERAARYMAAKKASMQFEEDVERLLADWAKAHDAKVSRGVIHESGGRAFVSDFQILRGTKKVCIQCKSSPREDRLALALAECIVGQELTGIQVGVVVPYLLPGCDNTLATFTKLGIKIQPLCHLQKLLD